MGGQGAARLYRLAAPPALPGAGSGARGSLLPAAGAREGCGGRARGSARRCGSRPSQVEPALLRFVYIDIYIFIYIIFSVVGTESALVCDCVRLRHS